jgi:hypothetical protein
MKRIPIGLTDAQHTRLRREAARRRKSVGALVRDAVDQAYPEEALSRRNARTRAQEVFGRYASGVRDVGERHDEHLGELERW